MSGYLDPRHVNRTTQLLKKRCMCLIIEGYTCVRQQSNISIDWEEEDISKELLLRIRERSINTNTWQIDVSPEYRIYTNNVAANESPRIDFRFTTWTSNVCVEYYAEAKNLIEANCCKIGRTSKIYAKGLHERYIATGVDHFISGHYPPNGFLVGYILQGNAESVINKINACLREKNRDNEILSNQPLNTQNFNACYVSNHNSPPSITHLMLDFT